MRNFMFGAAAALAVVSLVQVATTAQAPASSSYTGRRTPDGKPDLDGIWQALSEAHFNLEPHSAQMGIQAGMGVVEGGTIPYKPEAAKKQKENFENRFSADPLNKCYLPGVPRVTYLPFPFEIHHSPTHVIMASAFHHTTRTIYTDGTPHAQALDLWMGDSRGRSEYDANKPITLKGTVTKTEWINPHSWVYVDVKSPDGKVLNWAIELGAPNSLLRQGWSKNSMPVGSEIVVEGYSAKNGSSMANASNITTPDGKRMFAGSSGSSAPTDR